MLTVQEYYVRHCLWYTWRNRFCFCRQVRVNPYFTSWTYCMLRWLSVQWGMGVSSSHIS